MKQPFIRSGLALVAGVLLMGCGPRPRVPIGEPAHRGAYIYIEVSPDVFHVAIRNVAILREMLAEIGCGKESVCLVQKMGDLFVVERHGKSP